MAPRPKAKGVKQQAHRRDPIMEVKAVAELPAALHVSPRSTRYQAAMAEVRKRVGKGKWASIAQFDSPNGAAAVRRAITSGERPIDGKLSEWAVESRRMRNGNGEITGSELFVKLKG